MNRILTEMMIIRKPAAIVLTYFIALPVIAAVEILLYEGMAPQSAHLTDSENHYFSSIFQTQVITNVARPTITYFAPDPATATDTAVIIAPGGGFRALSINSEGIDMANWLNKKGISAFVLKYRLVPTGENSEEGILTLMQDQEKVSRENAIGIPLAVADGKAAVRFVRQHADEFSISSNKVGMVGFSAGGTIATYTALDNTVQNRLNFVGLIYSQKRALVNVEMLANAPPLFAAAASDDQLKLAPDSIDLFNIWQSAGRSAELHIYATGGHGFGMRRQNLPSDYWIEQFHAWLKQQGF